MRLSTASVLATLACSLAPGLALPAISSALVARAQTCANAPYTVAGSFLTRRSLDPLKDSNLEPDSLPHLPRRGTAPVIWCARGSTTYINITISAPPNPAPVNADSAIQILLPAAASNMEPELSTAAADVIPSGGFSFSRDPASMLVTSYAAGQMVDGATVGAEPMTWTVLGQAMWALQDYMAQKGYSGVTFEVFSGTNATGQGSVTV